MKILNLYILVCLSFFALVSSAKVEVNDDGEVISESSQESQNNTQDTRPVYTPTVTGEAAKAKYMKRNPSSERSTSSYVGGGSHFLSVHMGTGTESTAHRWGKNSRETDVTDLILGVNYRVGEWQNSMDLSVRVNFEKFSIAGDNPRKISFMPTLSFPDANAGFPLYVGGGIGLGVFLDQVESESSLSLDYSIFTGLRFFDLFNNVGVLTEIGLNNHLHILSDGQYNSVYIAVGSVFTF